MNNLIGQHLGPYRILEQIGVGGMATVYKAYQPAMDRHVAVKVITSHFAQDEMFLKRFRREARAVAKLEHAHILPVHDSGEAEGRLYLVMRYLDAGTLKDRMAEGTLPLSEVNRVVGQVGSALDYAHRMGVVHRDVKPANVLLDAEGDAFLTDFGLAKMMEASAQLTGTGVGVGTPAYMSPEQGKGAKVDSRADVYSLGVMLYEMVTGRAPYEAETPLAVVLKHITEPLPLPRSVRPDLPEEIERVILRAMAKETDDRFQTAGEMVRALDGAVRAADVAARTEPAVVQVAGAEPAVAEVAAPLAEGSLARAVAGVRRALPARWGQTAAWVAVGIVALVVLFLVLSRVPLRVQISGGQLEVVRVVEGTGTPEVALVATPTVAAAIGATATPTSRPTAIPTAEGTPTRTPRPAVVTAPTPAPVSSADQARAFAEPILAAIANRAPDFEDDFSTVDEGWSWDFGAQGPHTGNFEITEGVARMTLSEGTDASFGRDRFAFKNFVLSFDSRQVSGSDGSEQGIYLSSPGGFFIFHIQSGTRNWRLWKMQGDQGYVAADSDGDVVSPIGETNHIIVVARGPRLALYLNGVPIVYSEDKDFDVAHDIPFACGGKPDIVCEFDNVKLWNLEDVPGLPEAEATAAPTPAPGSSADQARTFAEPILAAIADRPPDFEDDFSTADEGWGLGQFEITEGVARMTLSEESGAHLAHNWFTFKNFVLSLDSRQVSGSYVSGQTVHLGISNGHLTLNITSGTRTWSSYKHHGDQVYYRLGGSGDVVSPIGEATHILVVARGPRLTFYLNDEPIAYVEDKDFDVGHQILFACDGQPDIVCEFDNVKLWNLDNVPGLPEAVAIPTPTPRPGVTPQPTATPTPNPLADQARTLAEPVLAAIADRAPDFEDDFSTADEIWYSNCGEQGSHTDHFEITDGAARMTLSEGSNAYLARDRFVFKNFVLMLDSRQVSGSYGSEQTVCLDVLDGPLTLNITSGTRTWSTHKHQGDQIYYEPAGSGDVVSPIGETNHILVVARGSRITYYLNDEPVAYVEDKDFDVGHNIFFMCSGQPDIVCEFDNVKLWNLDNVPGLP